MKHASTRFWLCTSGLGLAFLLVTVESELAAVGAQTSSSRSNELTLAGLRPGKDSIEKAKSFYPSGRPGEDPLPDPLRWRVLARGTGAEILFEGNPRHEIQTIVVRPAMIELDALPDLQTTQKMSANTPLDTRATAQAKPMTGKGLTLNNQCAKAIRLYGEPNSRSPSTKNGQPLELLYYAFDWAGRDVPQVMQVVCTVEKDGKPGRVVEIMLAADSL